jgi:hypothetical protein
MFAEEIVQLLVTAGIGTYGTNIFGGSAVQIPAGAGPFMNVVETNGRVPLRTHNSLVLPAYTRPSAQITARAANYADARAMNRRAFEVLAAVHNEFVEGLPVTASGISRVGSVATFAMPSNRVHNFFNGTRVRVSGAGQPEYNVTIEQIGVVNLSSFTYDVVGAPATPATGSPLLARASTWYQ